MADQIAKPVETLSPTAEQPKPPAAETVGRTLGVEGVEAIERGLPEAVETVADDLVDTEPVYAEPVAPVRRAPAQPVAPAKDKTLQKIEDILGEDMTDVFLKLPPDKQKLFKEKGEETASLIKQMIDGAKVNTKKIFDLIKKWLRLIPGINQFFLEQEAKIKTDKILNLRP